MWGIVVIYPSSSIEISSDDNADEKLWNFVKTCQNQKCKSCDIEYTPLTKMSYFSEFFSYIMQKL